MLRLSVIIVTHNRREALALTLDQLMHNAHLPHNSMEIIVIDNGSTDGTMAMVESRRDLPLRVIRRDQNEGVSARNYGFAQAKGEYLLLIDDDSYPVGDAVERSLAYLDQSQITAAVVGRVELRDGSAEASALPGVVVNCAVCLRKSVIDEVGGLPREFFRQAEEYDLSFRIWNAGYVIERFEDIVYYHAKAPGNRDLKYIHRYDLRNNLILIERYLPRKYRSDYRRDWIRRYSAFARHDGCASAARRAQLDGLVWRCREKIRGRKELNPRAFESIFQHEKQKTMIDQWAQHHHINHVIIADFSKNILATWHACKDIGLEIISVYDSHPAFIDTTYRGIPIINSIRNINTDGIVLSNVNPAQITPRMEMIKREFPGPTLQLWQGETYPDSNRAGSPIVEFKNRIEIGCQAGISASRIAQ